MPVSFCSLFFVRLGLTRDHDCATCCAERRLQFGKANCKLGTKRSGVRCRWFRFAPLAVACRCLSPALARLCQLALWAPLLAKTILNCFRLANPAGGAIFRGQSDNSSRNSLIFKDFFGFLGENLRKYFVTTFCESSGLEASTILRLCHLLC